MLQYNFILFVSERRDGGKMFSNAFRDGILSSRGHCSVNYELIDLFLELRFN